MCLCLLGIAGKTDWITDKQGIAKLNDELLSNRIRHAPLKRTVEIETQQIVLAGNLQGKSTSPDIGVDLDSLRLQVF